MKKSNFLWATAVCTVLSVSLVSCDNEDDPTLTVDPPMEQQDVLAYILNSGKMKSNNATLDGYNATAKKLTTKLFANANGRGLGDTANDMLAYGSKVYIAVSTSNTLEITDQKGKCLKTISPMDEAGKPQSPRYLAAYKGKVYLTLFDGHLACVDTTTMEITQKVKVGPNPYQVCEAGGKLYVANSGGYNPVQDSTLSVVDPVTFKEEKKIKVGLNPTTVKADNDGDLYVVCLGNFFDVKATVQRVDLKANSSIPIYKNDNILMNLIKDRLYVISSENDKDWHPINMKFISYDAKAEKELNGNFITDGTKVENPYSLSVCPTTGDLYIGTSDYVNTGDMYIFSTEGKLVNKFGVSGLNPIGAFFITK